jgi:hypothetical protein
MPAVTIAMAPATSIKLELPTGVATGGRWSLLDDTAGSFNPDPGADDDEAIYTHGTRVGIQKIVYSSPNGDFGVCNVITIVPHDHSDMYRGGPAYGVYKST